MAVTIDGRLEEPWWSEAARLDGFSRIEPVFGGSPARPTRVRVFYTETDLYVAIECLEPADELQLALTPRDEGPDGDYVRLGLDTFGDGQRVYAFAVSAAGSQVDWRDVRGHDSDLAWDAHFDSAVSIGADEYVVEVRIPFSDLRFSDHSRQRWGLQVERRLWSAQETVAWAPIDPSLQNDLAQYGVLELHDIEGGTDLQVYPSLTLSWQDAAESPTLCANEADVGSFTLCGIEGLYGVGARYPLGSALNLDAVFNPDFSQVEADPARLTLNQRFALYLDERRPFFLEGADLYDLPIPIVYTRSMAQPIAGLRLTGSAADGTRLGLLLAHDLDPPDSVLDSGFAIPRDADDQAQVQVTTSVARLEQDVLDSSRVGAVLVDREYTGRASGFSRLAEADARLELGDEWSVVGALAASWSQDLTDVERSGLAGYLRAVWRSEEWKVRLQDWVRDADFRAESGFLSRTGIDQLELQVDHYTRSDKPFLRFIAPGIDSYLDLDTRTGDPTEGGVAANTYWELGDRTGFFVEAWHNFEDFEDETFETNSGELSLWSGLWPALSPSIDVQLGEDILRDPELWPNGTPVAGGFLTLEGSVGSRPLSQLDLSAAFDLRSLYQRVLAEELTTQRILRLRATYLFSNVVNVRLIGEHLSPDDEVTLDALLTYLPSPGTVLFLGYRDTESVADGWALVERGVFFKFSYLFGV